jgi:polysaccharide deacetylase family protein (PEP-CTERM system associated)
VAEPDGTAAGGPEGTNGGPLQAMTVDVEDYYHVAAFADDIAREDWTKWPSRVEANTERMLDVLDGAGARATFFVLGWVAERHPSLVPRIVARGHEVGCHGYSHRLIYAQSPDEFRAETRRAKAVLEDQGGAPVAGYRAATFSIVKRTLWALDVLAEEGFLYDSSIFPVMHDRYGIPDAPRAPHRMTTEKGATIVEFPITVLNLLGMNLPLAGGGYFRLFPYGLTRWGLRRVAAGGRSFVFYCHPWEVDPDQPRVRTRWLSRFRHYNNLDRCEDRLRRLLGDFRFGTAREVLAGRGLLSA